MRSTILPWQERRLIESLDQAGSNSIWQVSLHDLWIDETAVTPLGQVLQSDRTHYLLEHDYGRQRIFLGIQLMETVVRHWPDRLDWGDLEPITPA